ncbi:MAG: hypothetical protein KTR14_10805 [Vampirovibrio sp.]|nr:hypothetical protein [Vampirovibrio sp.]
MSSSSPVNPQFQVSVLVFMKSLATPVVLYADNPNQLYDELKQLINNANAASPKLIEKPGIGPLKKVSFLDTELAGVAMQMDPTVGQQR